MYLYKVVKAVKEAGRRKLRAILSWARAQLQLVDTIVDIIISSIILAALWPALDSSLAKLVEAAKNSTNPLIVALSDAIPYLVGLILLTLLFGLIRWARSRST